MAKFQTRSGGHISIFVPWISVPIEIQAGGVYQTTDPREIQALNDSPEVVEVVEPSDADEPVAKDTKEPVEDTTVTPSEAFPKKTAPPRRKG